MSRRPALLAALAATLAAGAFVAAPASADNVAWSVSVGVPGLAVTAGAPGYRLAAPVYGPAYRPAYAYAPHRPYYRPYYRPYVPVIYGAPVVAPYPYPYAGALTYPARVVVAPRLYAPRRGVVAAPYYPPRAVPYGWN